MESFPNIPLPTKAGLFLKNQELFNVVRKYSDYLAGPKKKVFQRQKTLFEQNLKKISKTEVKKPSQPSPPPSNPIDILSPQNGKPHNLRLRSFNKNYSVLGGDLVNEPSSHQHQFETNEPDFSLKHIQNTIIKGPSLPGVLFTDRFSDSDSNMMVEDGYHSRNSSRSERINSKYYVSK